MVTPQAWPRSLAEGREGSGARRSGELSRKSPAQHFPGVHVAMTAAVFALIEQAVASPKHANDCRGVWHDILWMSRVSPVQVWQGGRLFRVIITGTGRKRLHTLKAIQHPDETGRPCLFTSPPSRHPLSSPLHVVSGPVALPQAISALPRYVTIMLPDED